MKNLFILTSVFLGSSLLATDVHTGKRTAINKRFSGTLSKGPVGTISIIIDKSDYELNVYDDKGCMKNGAAFFLLTTPPLQTVQNLISVSNGAKFRPMPVLVAV